MPQILHLASKDKESLLLTELGRYVVSVRTGFITHRLMLAAVIKTVPTSVLAHLPQNSGDNFNSCLHPHSKGAVVPTGTEVQGGLASGPWLLLYHPERS